MTHTAFAPSIPLQTRDIRRASSATRLVASASPSSNVAEEAATAATTAATAASNGGAFVAGTPEVAKEESEVKCLADIDEIVQLIDEFDVADFRLESDGVAIEITRPGGRGFVDGVLRDAPPAAAAGTALPAETSWQEQQEEEWEEEAEAPMLEDVVQDVPASDVSEEKSGGADTNVVYDSDFVVKSNRVGFFFSGARNKPPLVNVGDHVGFNQPVCIIEQLKQQYVYLSEVSGTVTKIFVEDGDSVQYDQQVMVIRPD